MPRVANFPSSLLASPRGKPPSLTLALMVFKHHQILVPSASLTLHARLIMVTKTGMFRRLKTLVTRCLENHQEALQSTNITAA